MNIQDVMITWIHRSFPTKLVKGRLCRKLPRMDDLDQKNLFILSFEEFLSGRSEKRDEILECLEYFSDSGYFDNTTDPDHTLFAIPADATVGIRNRPGSL